MSGAAVIANSILGVIYGFTNGWQLATDNSESPKDRKPEG